MSETRYETRDKRAGSGRLNVMDGVRWQEQSADECAAWHVSNGLRAGSFPSAAARVSGPDSDWRAGFAEGWRECLKVLKLHGIVHEYDRVRK